MPLLLSDPVNVKNQIQALNEEIDELRDRIHRNPGDPMRHEAERRIDENRQLIEFLYRAHAAD